MDQAFLQSLKPGDIVVRLLAGKIPVRLKVTAVDAFIHCGPWKFSLKTGAEIDEELGWTNDYGPTGSYLVDDDSRFKE